MSKRRKRLEKLRQNPKDVAFDDLRKVLEDFGFELVRSKGSHFAFRHHELNEMFILPYRKPHVKTAYVEQFLMIVEQLLSLDDDKDEADE